MNSKVSGKAEEVIDRLLQQARELGLGCEQFEVVLSIVEEKHGVLEFTGRLILDPNEVRQSVTANLSHRSATKTDLTPFWNGSELWWSDRVIKRFRKPAQNQHTVLAVFQEEGWPKRIDNPIPANEQCDAHSRLHDTIKSLNRNHIPDPSPIKFRGDGTGTGVIWEVTMEGRSSDTLQF